MKRTLFTGTLLLCVLLCVAGLAIAAPRRQWGTLTGGDYQLTSISNHTPWGDKSFAKYLNSLQRIEMETGKLSRFRDLPVLGMKDPYTGYITLGDQDQKFGFIVDVCGEEKRLYVDTDGDGSFAGEKYSLLCNDWLMGQYTYFVVAPEPVRVKVHYKNGQTYPIEFNVLGNIFPAGTVSKQKPVLFLQVRTWFLTKLVEDGTTKLAAIVDHNNNGCFNDRGDWLFIDYNNDGFFTQDEAMVNRNGVKLKWGKQKVSFTWEVYPRILRIKEGT